MPNCNPCSWGRILSGDRGVSGSSRASYLACTMMSNENPGSIKVEGWYPRSPPPHTHSNRPNSPTPFPKLPAYCLRIATMSFIFFTSEGFIYHHINDSCVCDHMHTHAYVFANVTKQDCSRRHMVLWTSRFNFWAFVLKTVKSHTCRSPLPCNLKS